MLTAIIAAAGSGSRMGASGNKQFIKIAGQPVLTRTLLSLRGLADRFVLVAKPGEEDLVGELAAACLSEWIVVRGGQDRQESVYNGLLASQDSDFVMIHDGARPFVSPQLVSRVLNAARETGAAIPGISVTDTIKTIDGGKVETTLERSRLRAVQTPQIFTWNLLMEAHNNARQQGLTGTDDASLVEALGHPVAIVVGDPANIKITTPEDLSRARFALGLDLPVRVGNGFDVHRLAQGRPLILGGVTIPWPQGLLGHSDADVLVHAIMDALLGAAGLGDIGRHFPDSDSSLLGANSLGLLARVSQLISQRGWGIGNIDGVIIAERPKLAPYIEQMNENIATVLDISPSSVNIKATTTEGLGYAGRQEGIAAQAVCTLVAQ